MRSTIQLPMRRPTLPPLVKTERRQYDRLSDLVEETRILQFCVGLCPKISGLPLTSREYEQVGSIRRLELLTLTEVP
jgi:hypothetical protein